MDDSRRCVAVRGEKGRCKRWAILGGTVCATHGGSIGRVKRKAAQRVRDMLADAIDPDRVLRESGRLAYSDIGQLFDDAGNFLPIKQWPDDIRRAVASVEFVKKNVTTGDGKTDDVIKVRLWDKVAKLTNLMKHHGQLVERVEHSGSVDVVGRLVEARKRLNGAKRG